MSLGAVLAALQMGSLECICNVCGKSHVLCGFNEGDNVFFDNTHTLYNCVDKRIKEGLATIADSVSYRSMSTVVSDLFLRVDEMRHAAWGLLNSSNPTDCRSKELAKAIVAMHFSAQTLDSYIQFIPTRNFGWYDSLMLNHSWLLALPAREANRAIVYIRYDNVLKASLMQPLINSCKLYNNALNSYLTTVRAVADFQQLDDRTTTIYSHIGYLKGELKQWQEQVEQFRKEGFDCIDMVYT